MVKIAVLIEYQVLKSNVQTFTDKSMAPHSCITHGQNVCMNIFYIMYLFAVYLTMLSLTQAI
jgi:hypothetical protein